MLKKIHRLTKQKDFDLVLKQGQKVYAPILMIRYLKNDSLNFRLGIIVSNKVSKKATLRNLIKRRLREIIRVQAMKNLAGYDLVIVVSPKIIDSRGKVLDYDEIKNSLLAGLSKARLI